MKYSLDKQFLILNLILRFHYILEALFYCIMECVKDVNLCPKSVTIKAIKDSNFTYCKTQNKMTKIATQIKKVYSNESSSAENKKEIDGHKKIASQLAEALILHLAAAAYLENNDQEEAFNIAVRAYGMINLAKESQQIIIDESLNALVLF